MVVTMYGMYSVRNSGKIQDKIFRGLLNSFVVYSVSSEKCRDSAQLGHDRFLSICILLSLVIFEILV